MNRITIVLNTESTDKIKQKVDRLAKAVTSYKSILGEADKVDLIVNVNELKQDFHNDSRPVRAIGFLTDNGSEEDEVYEDF